jgi:hypothetical protein
MANIDVTQDAELTSNTAPTLADRLLLVRASNSSLTDITPDQFMKIINLLTEDTAPTSSDFVVTYDASASAAKKVALGSAFVWTSFTPSWTNLTVGDGTNLGSYTHVGKTTFFRIIFTFGSTSSIGGSVSVNFPATSASLTGSVIVGNVRLVDATGSTYFGNAMYLSTAAMIVTSFAVSGSSIIQAALSSTAPFTWATSDAIQITGFYERA